MRIQFNFRNLLHFNVWILLWYIALVLYVHNRRRDDVSRTGRSVPVSPQPQYNSSHTSTPHHFGAPGDKVTVRLRTSPPKLVPIKDEVTVPVEETTEEPRMSAEKSLFNASHHQIVVTVVRHGKHEHRDLKDEGHPLQPKDTVRSGATSAPSRAITSVSSPPKPAKTSPPRKTASGDAKRTQQKDKRLPAVISQKDDPSTLFKVNLTAEIELAVNGSPKNFLPNYRSPCWISRMPPSDPYKGHIFSATKPQVRNHNIMRRIYRDRAKSKGTVTRYRCLPLVYLIGVTKSGTTDLYERILKHPQVYNPGTKEPNYWSARRVYATEATALSDYLNIYDYVGQQISEHTQPGSDYHPGVTIDASPNYLWNFDGWWKIPGNKELDEPRFILPHTLRRMVPQAKVIAILREPTDRLYSQFRMWSGNYSSEVFHKLVIRSLDHMTKCLSTHTLRSCVYLHAHTLEMKNSGYDGLMKRRGMYLRASMYYPFVRDWLDVFPRDQILVLRAEDYFRQRQTTLNKVIQFLGLDTLRDKDLQNMVDIEVVNTRSDYQQRSPEPMLDKTKKLLQNFFRPYNRQLADVLGDKGFLWEDTHS